MLIYQQWYKFVLFLYLKYFLCLFDSLVLNHQFFNLLKHLLMIYNDNFLQLLVQYFGKNCFLFLINLNKILDSRTSDKLEKNLQPERCDLCCCPLDLDEDQSLLSDPDRIKLVHQLFDTSSHRYLIFYIKILFLFEKFSGMIQFMFVIHVAVYFEMYK
jgi:hypothetical protein